jgi:metal-responsive CopG/Arc/MetJ family transcriptional regulator
MSTFTSTLPDDLLYALAEKAKSLKMPKNKLIEQALRLYLDQLNKAEYIKSYKAMSQDTDVMVLAEEGMDYYCRELEEGKV